MELMALTRETALASWTQWGIRAYRALFVLSCDAWGFFSNKSACSIKAFSKHLCVFVKVALMSCFRRTEDRL